MIKKNIKMVALIVGVLLLCGILYWAVQKFGGSSASVKRQEKQLQKQEQQINQNLQNTITPAEKEVAALKQQMANKKKDAQKLKDQLAAYEAEKKNLKEPQNLQELKDAFKTLGYPTL